MFPIIFTTPMITKPEVYVKNSYGISIAKTDQVYWWWKTCVYCYRALICINGIGAHVKTNSKCLAVYLYCPM